MVRRYGSTGHMAQHYKHTCHMLRMYQNHPCLIPGYPRFDPTDENSQTRKSSDNEPKLSSASKLKHDDKITAILPNISFTSSSSFPESSSMYNNIFHDDPQPDERLTAKLVVNEKADHSVRMLEYKDDAVHYLLLDSKSSPNDFPQTNNDVLTRNKRYLYRKLPKPAKMPIEDEKSTPAPRMDWTEYHRLQTIHNFLDNLEYDYPSICTAGAIGTSLEGRDLKILKISNTDSTNVSVWIDAGIHAREWIAPAVATYIANHIATNFHTMPDSITNKDWYFLPVVNPDGYEYSHTVDRMWRKNKAWHAGQCVGVDLNRNFSFGWGGKGSSCNPTNAFYRGSQPFSEPESTAMRDMLINSRLSFKVYITLHSYGEVIIFPFAFKDDLCPDYVRLLEGATVMSKAIHETNGNIYKVGISRDVMYGAAGTSSDFSYGQAGIPYCYLIELRSKKHKFRLPKEEIEETGAEILNCVKALMEFIDKYPLKIKT